MTEDTRVVTCLGCNADVILHKAVSVWISTPMGMTCRHAHPGCEDAVIAHMAAKWGGARRSTIKPEEKP